MIHHNLPDGCTPDDIDIAMGGSIRCHKCRKVYDSENTECPRCAYLDEHVDDLMEYHRERRELNP